MTAAEGFLDRLDGVRRNGSGWTAKCPAHEDRHASLSVAEGDDGRVLVKCHAGCDAETVAAAVGLELADLFERPEKPPAAKPAKTRKPPAFRDDQVAGYVAALRGNAGALARLEELRGWTADAVERLELGLDDGRITFPYRDAAGRLVGVARYQPNPDRRGDRPKMQAAPGSRRELFPAPETLTEETLWLLEGEPDAVRAHSLGLAAVALPGVEGWRAESAQRFSGRRVVVCLDCDAPGREAAQRVAGDLAGVAADVRVLDLNRRRDDGYDLSDFTTAAATPEQRDAARRLLEQSAQRAPRVEPPKPEDGATLLDDVAAFLRRYVVLPGEQESTALALFAVHTHALEAAHATPYLVVLSPERRTGKTLLLELLELLAARPWRIVSASEAAMFRKIAQDRPTLLLDEIDAIFGSATERTEPLRAVLNAGNRPGAAVARCVGDGAEQRVVDFPVFGPKVLAGIDTGRLPDTIRDRAVELRMKRKTAAEQVERFRRRRVEPAAGELRDRVARFAAENVDRLRGAEPPFPDELNDRAAEAWEPLLAIADVAGGDWPARARAAAVGLAADADAEEATYGARLLGKLGELLRGRAAVATDAVLEAVNGDEELPFGGWRDGKGLDARTLARLLRPYGVRPRTVRLDDESTAKGYRRDHATEEAFTRYTGHPLQEASQPSHPSHDNEASHQEPHNQAVVTDVTLVTANPQGVTDVTSTPTPGGSQ